MNPFHACVLAAALLLSTRPVLPQTLDSPRLRATLQSGGALEVLDKVSGITWRQPVTDIYVSDARTDGATMTWLLDNQFRVSATLRDNEIAMVIGGEPSLSIGHVEYPAGFLPESPKSPTLILPNCTGLAIPFSEMGQDHLQRVPRYYDACIGQQGLMMPWVGVTDGGAGTLMLLDTPVDARVKIEQSGRGYECRAAWLDEKGSLTYERQVRFVFTETGGYVALCKWYRKQAQEAGFFVSLRDKRRTHPALDQFIGAMNLWVVDWPDMELFKMTRKAGIDKLLVNYHVGRKPPGIQSRPGRNATYEPMSREFVAQLHDLGYLAGRYDYYRTIYPPSRRNADTWIMRSIGYTEQCALDAEGRVYPGFLGQPGDPDILGHRCSVCQLAMARVYIPGDVDRIGYDARLIDTICAVNWHECYSPFHPVTRREDMEQRIALLKFQMDYGQISGTEHAAHWAVPVLHYAEAPTTFASFFQAPRENRLNTTPLEVPDIYRKITLNEKLRAPLWQLVFHDAVVVTERWNWTPNRFTDGRDWEQQNLLNLLHGHMPTILLDKDDFLKNRNMMIRTYKDVCEWNTRTGYEEMINHEWLTADGSVQRVTYESGKSVTVNFGEQDFKGLDGMSVKARGFRTEE